MPGTKHHRKSPGPMHSQAQWRYLYSIKAPFAHKWAEQVEAERGKKTGYHSLPGHSAHLGTAKHAARSSRSKPSNRSHAMRKALLKK